MPIREEVLDCAGLLFVMNPPPPNFFEWPGISWYNDMYQTPHMVVLTKLTTQGERENRTEVTWGSVVSNRVKILN